MSVNQAKTSAELAKVIEAAMGPIEKAFESVLQGVHEHGKLEERERMVKWLRALALAAQNAGLDEKADALASAARAAEAGELS